ncbi:hypothetical protein SSX86_029522 [Deinandra increscens subsp. villosa]
MDMLRSTYHGKSERWLEMKHNEEFNKWMKTKVTTTYGQSDVDSTVEKLGLGPDFRVKSYQGYDINGYTFYTKDQDEKSTVQNNGVTVIASTTEFDRTDHDKRLRIAKDSYYGVIQEIWELNYTSFTIPVFKCKWVDNRKDMSSKRGRGKRGVTTCSDFKEEWCSIEFDEDMQPMGENREHYTTWIGVACKSQMDYHIETKKFTPKQWDDLWKEVKEKFKIPNDNPKEQFIKSAKRTCTNFRSHLYRKYYKEGKEPFTDYPYLVEENWADFIATRSNDAFLVKSEKAKASALENKDPHKCGRPGYKGLKPKLDTVWSQCVSSAPHLKEIHNFRSKMYIAARSTKNKQTKLHEVEPNFVDKAKGLALHEKEMKENGSYFQGRGDPITSFLGAEHGGRTRGISNIIVSNDASVYASPGDRGSNGESGRSYYDYIKVISRCNLLFPWQTSMTPKPVVAIGQVYPSSHTILHGKKMSEGCVKVQVDTVIEPYDRMPAPDVTCTDEVKFIGDTISQFIQWPRDAIELESIGAPCRSMSGSTRAMGHTSSQQLPLHDFGTTSCYRPELVEDDPYEHIRSIHRHTKTHELDMDRSFADLLEDHAMENVESMPLNTSHPPNLKILNALEKIKKRPLIIQQMGEKLSTFFCVGHNDYKIYKPTSPPGMYPEIITDHVHYHTVLEVLAKDLVDISFIHWSAMFLYKFAHHQKGQPSSKCVFLNPYFITSEMCVNEKEQVKEHIQSVHALHIDKPYIVAPYYAGLHWSLHIISYKYKRAYILDSIMTLKSKDCYQLPSIIEDALNTTFDWEMVKCKQQVDDWECGYITLQHMIEFVNRYQHSLPDDIWNDNSYVSDMEIDKWILSVITAFFIDLE